MEKERIDLERAVHDPDYRRRILPLLREPAESRAHDSGREKEQLPSPDAHDDALRP